MSRGPGRIEQRITKLFAATKDRALSVADLCNHAFELHGAPASRAQRLSATRAAHRLLRRGIKPMFWWRATETADHRIRFHDAFFPVRIWAVSVQPAGVVWADAEITKITERNVIVRYGGEYARLDRLTLAIGWAWWRGVMFAASRAGRIAQLLDDLWHERYGMAGGVPPAMQMPLAEAIALLGMPQNYTREDVIAAFRRAVKRAHPDLGGTADDFHRLVEARDRLLAALGTSAPSPKMPAYYPSGTTISYRSRTSRRRRLGQTGRLGHTRQLTG
jgi:hypothetical protein